MSGPSTVPLGSSASSSSRPILSVEGIGISFGGLKAVQDFSMDLPRGALYGLIGPNGAGKTTAFNLLTGVYAAQSGTVTLDGERIDELRPHQIAKSGLSRTFQNIRLFGELSVLDNVRVACHLRGKHSLFSTLLRLPVFVRQEERFREHAMRLLSVFELQDRAHVQAKNLPYGDQRRLEIVRALATEPKVLLLDEPAAGMNPNEKLELAKSIESIRGRFNLSILLIEHDMGLVMDICERIAVLDYGKRIAFGTPAEIQRDPRVIEAYLGEPEPGAGASNAENPSHGGGA